MTVISILTVQKNSYFIPIIRIIQIITYHQLRGFQNCGFVLCFDFG